LQNFQTPALNQHLKQALDLGQGALVKIRTSVHEVAMPPDEKITTDKNDGDVEHVQDGGQAGRSESFKYKYKYKYKNESQKDGDAAAQKDQHDDHKDGSNNEGKDKDGKEKDGQEKKDEKPRSKKPLIIIAIVVLVLLIVGFIVWFLQRNQTTTDDAYTDDNTHVHKGDLLLRIDPRDYLAAQAQARAQLALANAQVTTAKEALRIARVQYPAQLQSAQAQQQAAAAALALANSSYERQHQVDRRATTQESIDSSTSQQLNAAANLKGAKAQVEIANLVPEQVQQAINTVAEREAAVAQAQAQVDQADLNLSYTEVRAPSDGFVTQRNVQLGSYQAVGQVMFLLVTPDVWITANFKESQIGRMRPGDKVDIKIDAYSGFKLEGHVQSIQYGSGSRFSAFPAENATGNFVKIVQRIPVKIVIDKGLDPNRPLPLGLSVDPVVYFP
jgi:membrane fusion protein (multidrug efflux system)